MKCKVYCHGQLTTATYVGDGKAVCWRCGKTIRSVAPS